MEYFATYNRSICKLHLGHCGSVKQRLVIVRRATSTPPQRANWIGPCGSIDELLDAVTKPYAGDALPPYMRAEWDRLSRFTCCGLCMRDWHWRWRQPMLEAEWKRRMLVITQGRLTNR